MKFLLIFSPFLFPYVSSIFEKDFEKKDRWEDPESLIIHQQSWNKYHPQRRKQPIDRGDEISPRWYESSLIEHWNDHSHDHNHTHEHLQEHEHAHDQTHLHVEEHDHTHEHAHTHKHNHLHEQSHNHKHEHNQEHEHKHKHKHKERHHHDHHEYYSKRRRLSDEDEHDEDPYYYEKHPNHQYNRKPEMIYQKYYNQYRKEKSPIRESNQKRRPQYMTERGPEKEKDSSYKKYYPTEKTPQVEISYSNSDERYPTQREPSMGSTEDYRKKSVEEYIGDSGKEFESAAEKIVEGYMGDYMDKYMNEWYIKYCRETGKYCDQIKVIQKSKEKNTESNSAYTEHPSPNQYVSMHAQKNNVKKEVSYPNYPRLNRYEPKYNYEDPPIQTPYEKSPVSNIQELIERDKYMHNKMKAPKNHLSEPLGPIVYLPKYPPEKNVNNFYNDGTRQRPPRNQANKGRKRRGRKQNRNRRPNYSGQYKNDQYRDFDLMEDLFSGTSFEEPLPYNNYNGYHAIEETDIDNIGKSFGQRY